MPFVALLPERKSDNPKRGRRACRFDACTDAQPDRDGTLEAYAPGKPTERYAVTEFPHDLAGRAFRLVKCTAGTDPEAGCYDVLLGEGNQEDSCECRGFLRWGHCKHVDSLRAVIAEGALYRPLANPDADCGPTEFEDVYATYEDAWGNVIAFA